MPARRGRFGGSRYAPAGYLTGTPSSPVTYCARPKPNDRSPAVFST